MSFSAAVSSQRVNSVGFSPSGLLVLVATLLQDAL